MRAREARRKALQAAATKGPWAYSRGTGAISSAKMLIGRGVWPDSGPFIAHAREDVPWLVAEVERLRAELAAKEAP